MELHLDDWGERTLTSLSRGPLTVADLVEEWDKKPKVFEDVLDSLQDQFAAIPTKDGKHRLTILGEIFVDQKTSRSQGKRIGFLDHRTALVLLRKLLQHTDVKRVPNSGIPLWVLGYLADPEAQSHYSFKTRIAHLYRDQAVKDLWVACGALEAAGLLERRYPSDDKTRWEDCFVYITTEGMELCRKAS